jgi:hypothetical protein
MLRKFLVANKVDAVLVEFGPAGVAAMDAMLVAALTPARQNGATLSRGTKKLAI